MRCALLVVSLLLAGCQRNGDKEPEKTLVVEPASEIAKDAEKSTEKPAENYYTLDEATKKRIAGTPFRDPFRDPVLGGRDGNRDPSIGPYDVKPDASGARKEPTYKEKLLSTWVKELKYGNAKERADAAFALGQMAVDEKEAVAALASALLDRDDDVVKISASALGKIGAAGVPALILALQDDNEMLGGAAAVALVEAGKIAVPSLVRLLGSRKKATVSSASAILIRIGRPAVPSLITASTHEDSQIRGFAVLSLGKIGAPASDAVPALKKRLDDDHPGVRKAAEEALKAIGP